jgi:ATP-dependent DNA ligase
MLLTPPLPAMEARSVEEIPTGHGWQYEPKWDGFRCIAFREGAISRFRRSCELHP